MFNTLVYQLQFVILAAQRGKDRGEKKEHILYGTHGLDFYSALHANAWSCVTIFYFIDENNYFLKIKTLKIL